MSTDLLARVCAWVAVLAFVPAAHAYEPLVAQSHIDMHPPTGTIPQAFPTPASTLCLGSACPNVPVALAAERSQAATTRPSASACFNSSGQPAAVPYDIDGNCTSDLLWMNDETHQFGWWTLAPVPYSKGYGTRYISQLVSVAPGYWIAASGDFNNDGMADLIWTSDNRDLYLWTSTGSGFTASYIGVYPAGWTLVGAADIDGDGYDDLIWENVDACEFGYWLMRGNQVVNRTTVSIACGYHINFIETAFDSPNGTTPAIYWQGPANQNGLAATYQWLPQGQVLNASFYSNLPANWTFIAGLRQWSSFNQFLTPMVFDVPTTDGTNTLMWTDNFDVAGAQGMTEMMAGYRVVAAGHFTNCCTGEGTQDQEILWANGAGQLVIWPLDTTNDSTLLTNDLLGRTGYSLPNFPAGAGWYVVRPGMQN